MSNDGEPQDLVEAWKARWPNYCRTCGGWGLLQYGDAQTGESTAERCDALPLSTCHRCGAPDGLDPKDEVGLGCSRCGWNFDDGVPEDDSALGIE
jgi:hypothetical protein